MVYSQITSASVLRKCTKIKMHKYTVGIWVCLLIQNHGGGERPKMHQGKRTIYFFYVRHPGVMP